MSWGSLEGRSFTIKPDHRYQKLYRSPLVRSPPDELTNHIGYIGNSAFKIFAGPPVADIEHTYTVNTTDLEESIDSWVVRVVYSRSYVRS